MVEAAVMFPLLVLLILGGIDVGRAIMVQHTLVSAARSGCRCYSVPDELTQNDVTSVIELVMKDDQLDGYTVAFDPPSSAAIKLKEPVTVSVSLSYDNVAWTPSWFLSGRTLTGSCTMPGDTSQVN